MPLDDVEAEIHALKAAVGPQAEPQAATPNVGAAVAAGFQTFSSQGPANPYPPPFDATSGIRSWSPPMAPNYFPPGGQFDERLQSLRAGRE